MLELQNDKLNKFKIPQCERDFQKFKSAEMLGAPFDNARLRGIIYEAAYTGYRDGWITGLRQGWTRVNTYHQHLVTERYRTSFVIGKLNDEPYRRDSIEAPPVVNTMTPPESWMQSMVGFAVRVHMSLYAGYYGKSQFAIESDIHRATRFYHSLLTKSWRHGWFDGETEASQQYVNRIKDARLCPMAQIEKRLQEEEVVIIERLASEMFGYEEPIEGWDVEGPDYGIDPHDIQKTLDFKARQRRMKYK